MVALLSRLADAHHALESSTYSFFLPDAVRSTVGAGDVALAERLALFPTLIPDQQLAALAATAILAEARGEPDAAAGIYADAAHRWEAFGVLTEHAFALLGQGRCLGAVGQPTEAGAPLREAREMFAAMGARLALEATESLLQKTAALAS